jgi:hypothetical protein
VIEVRKMLYVLRARVLASTKAAQSKVGA